MCDDAASNHCMYMYVHCFIIVQILLKRTSHQTTVRASFCCPCATDQREMKACILRETPRLNPAVSNVGACSVSTYRIRDASWPLLLPYTQRLHLYASATPMKVCVLIRIRQSDMKYKCNETIHCEKDTSCISKVVQIDQPL